MDTDNSVMEVGEGRGRVEEGEVGGIRDNNKKREKIKSKDQEKDSKFLNIL